MKLITIIFGFLLTVLGVWNFAAVPDPGLGALMPAIFGLLAILFGLLQGRWEHKNPLFGAVMMAILTLIGSIRGLWNLVILLTGGTPALPTDLIWIRSLRGLVSIIFIGLVILLVENVWRHWKEFGHFLGDWLARVVLTIFYFTVLVPFGLGVRLFADPLHIKSTPAEQWRPRTTGDQNFDEVLRQY
ncbi:MAG: hypothetical protein D6768_13570 [Chloroflexi bacterium]|nr:MAG: hypothetical protein D6768_13570 [Chloroflexota bacterium]